MMFRRKSCLVIVLAVVACVLISSLLSGCGGEKATDEGARNEVELTDLREREVTLACPVESVVVTDDNAAEPVRLLAAEDKVVGVPKDLPEFGYFPVMSEKTVTGSQYRGLNYEKIAELDPDVVILLEHEIVSLDEIIEKLDGIGVEALVIDVFHGWDKKAESITLLGKVLGKEKRAEDYLSWGKAKLDLVQERLKDLTQEEKPSFWFKGLQKFTPTYGDDSLVSDTVEMAGLSNIFQFEGEREVSLESVGEKNPDFIFLGDWEGQTAGYTVTDPAIPAAVADEMKSKPAVSLTSAAKDNRVFVHNYVLDITDMEIGVLYYAKVAHPDSFQDIDPVKIHEEYFREWLREEPQGIWFYPRPWEG